MKQCYSIGMSNRDQPKADVLQGTLDLMVLQTLDSLGPLHGYAIAARLEQVSGGALQLNMGTLYPAPDAARAARTAARHLGHDRQQPQGALLRLTPAGRRQLAKEKQAWDRMAGIIHSLLRGEDVTEERQMRAASRVDAPLLGR